MRMQSEEEGEEGTFRVCVCVCVSESCSTGITFHWR